MGATNQKLWTNLCQLLQRPDLIDHPEYGTIPLRLKNREALIEELEREFAKRDSAQWIDIMLEAGIPAGPILSYPEAFEGEHGTYRNRAMDIDHPIEGKEIGRASSREKRCKN